MHLFSAEQLHASDRLGPYPSQAWWWCYTTKPVTASLCARMHVTARPPPPCRSRPTAPRPLGVRWMPDASHVPPGRIKRALLTVWAHHGSATQCRVRHRADTLQWLPCAAVLPQGGTECAVFGVPHRDPGESVMSSSQFVIPP